MKKHRYAVAVSPLNKKTYGLTPADIINTLGLKDILAAVPLDVYRLFTHCQILSFRATLGRSKSPMTLFTDLAGKIFLFFLRPFFD